MVASWSRILAAPRNGPQSRSPSCAIGASMTFSSTLILAKGRGIWKVRPSPKLKSASGAKPVTSCPPRCTVPLVGLSMPVKTLKSVVLPAPFGPINPVIVPARMSNDTSLTARNSPKSLLMLRMRRRGSAMPAMHRVVGIGVQIVFHDPTVTAAPVAFEPVDIALRSVGFVENRVDDGIVIRRQRNVEGLERLRQVSRITRADDAGRDLWLVQHPARRDGGQGNLVFVANGVERAKQGLKPLPRAEFVDDQAVFHQTAVLELETRIGGIQPFLGDETAR